MKEKTADEMFEELGYELEDKKIKSQILADKLMSLLQLVDSFIESLTDEDYELLKETRDCLQDKINYGNSASVVIIASGGNYDDTEDRMKIKTLDCLIDLLNSRKEYKERLLKQQEEQKNRQEAVDIFRAMGMF
jgi:hypothetical protein